MVSGPSRPECIVGHVFDSANDENYVYMAYKRANIEFGSPVKLIVIMTQFFTNAPDSGLQDTC